MSVIEINYGQGWKKTVYKPMDKFSAVTIKDRLQSQYTEYQYRVVDVARWVSATRPYLQPLKYHKPSEYYTMNSIDLTEQVWEQLQHYAERIAYLQSIGDDKSAEVLISSGELMAEAADRQDEWLIAQQGE